MRDRLYIPGIFFLALVLRLFYIWDISDNPFFTDLIIDLKAYDNWAREIAAGNWIGGKVFYQSPLYPYFLAVIYSIFGRNLILVYIIQAVLGAAGCLVIYAIGKEIFDRRVGIIAGFGAAIYNMFIFYQALVLKTFLGVLLVDLAILLLLYCRRRNINLIVPLLAGISLGLAALVRDNALALIPFFGLWLVFAQKGEKISNILRPVLIWSIGLFLVLGICLARNYYVGHDWVLTTSQGGQNFYIGNHRDNYWGTYKAPDFIIANPEFEEKDFRDEAELRTGRKDLKPSDLSRYWYGQAFNEILEEPALFLLRLFRKTLIFINQEEVPDNLNYYLYRTRFSLVLKFPLVNFAVLAPFGFLGLALGLRDRKGILLGIYLAVYSATVILFFVFGRYRLSIAGPLLVFAGFALIRLKEMLWSKQYRKLIPWLSLLIVSILLTEIPLHKPSYASAFYNLGNVYARQGNYANAVESYQDALKEDSENIHVLINLSKALIKLGDIDQAIQVLEKAVEIDPGYLPARMSLGIAFYKKNRLEEAIILFEEVIEKDPDNITALLYLADISAKSGDRDKALKYFKKVLDIEPGNEPALEGLKNLEK